MIATTSVARIAKGSPFCESRQNMKQLEDRSLHHDRARRGLPIATGVIEGACRELVQDRMGRSGAVWSAAEVEAVVRLRALRTSGEFDDYWQYTLNRHQAHEQ